MHDPYAALRFPGFRLLLFGNLVASLGGQMLTLAIGWELYERTDSALALGLVGLVQLIPVFLLFLVTGHVADRYRRKTVVTIAQLGLVLASLGLAAISYLHGSLVVTYACLLVRGIGSAFSGPAASALPAEIVPEEVLENSASWRNSFGGVASVVGPAVGGLVIEYAHSATLVYLFSALAALAFVVLLSFVPTASTASARRKAQAAAGGKPEPSAWRSLGEGAVFLWRSPIILSAITLDLFAVLFGGATTLLPIFARDILQAGPSGLGWLAAAPSIGVLLVSLYLAHQPPLRRAGPTLLLAVAGFGVATVCFGLSRSFWLSFAMLLALGGLDCISMVVRDTLMLTRIPDAMRGRVAAIEGLFVSSSNQLGGFESGLTAQFFGPILSVVGGGIGTVLVVGLVARRWPELRQLRSLREAV